MVDFFRKVGIIISIIEPFPKYDKNVTSLSQVVKLNSATVKVKKISAITNANILNHKTAELLESKSKKTLEEIRSLDQYYIADCYKISSESLTEEFISKYGNYNHIKWFRAYKKLRDAGTDNEMAVEAITRKDYREDRLTTITRAERYWICLELLKICILARDIDDRARYKSDVIKMHLNSPKSISHFQDLLVLKMVQVFDNTDASCRVKKLGLKTD
ncbi:hypothetical protein C1646_676206 [Rhizophagus diaphanus]|nr:hypothetical protein C1646_676206 [Rhizophagus diaphanus] [Rhizophagus sp. MUCL 43196]